MMLDIYGCAPAKRGEPVIRGAEFLRIELCPLADGLLFVAMTATTVDSEEAQLLDQEIASERVATIDQVLALIREHVRINPAAAPTLA
jgi:hypothetical protein